MTNRALITLAIMTGLLSGGVGLFGCAAQGIDPAKVDQLDDSGGKEDRWRYDSDPSRFGGDLVYTIDDLPLEGRSAHEAWPSTYWPTYEDSINVRWHGNELSPAQKYDMAFNDWTPPEGFDSLRPFDRYNWQNWDQEYYDQQGPLAKYVSNNMGNRSDRDAARAAIDGDGQRPDEWPVETWWGLCHAWVPSSMLEDRPMRSVTYNGVTFHVGDMEALLIGAYNRTSASMIGGRCNTGSGDSTVERDEHGRAVDVTCRDSNPGAFHVIMTNFLGLQHRPYAEDRTYDYQVWNQPVVAYEVTKMEEITLEQANQLLGLTGDTYEYNPDAVKFYEVNANHHYISESSASTEPADASRHERTDRYTYILEVDADGKIIGGEWTGSSRTNHPDFLWNPRRPTRSAIPNLNIDNIRMLIQMSRGDVPPPPDGDTITVNGPGGMDIPDNNATGISADVEVSDNVTIGQLQIALNVTHTYVGDLKIALTHNGTERVVYNREGGSSDDIDKTITVPGFDGQSASGTWTLHVVDTARLDTGRLNSWSLVITPGDGSEPPPPPPDGEMTFPGMGGISIPDNDATGITSTATVPAGTTGTIAAQVSITHTYIGDLKVILSNGTRSFTLHDREGGSADDINETYDVDFDGVPGSDEPADVSGTWTLSVSDHAGADVGTLNSWSLIVRN